MDKNRRYHECGLPGGAALIEQLLSARGLTKYKPLKKTSRCERFELNLFENKQAGTSGYTIGRSLGFTDGDTKSPVTEKVAFAIVADEGMGAPTLPPDDIPVLWASNKALPPKKNLDKRAENCFLLLDVNVLRKSGAMISTQISWERSVTELLWQLHNNPALSYLCKIPHILITFAEDGAVYIRREKGEPRSTLVLAHGNGEGFLRGKSKGAVNDCFALMTAALAVQFPDVINGTKPLQILPVLNAAKTLLTQGYPLEQLNKGRLDMPATETGEPEMPFEIPFVPGQNVVDPDFWCISNNAGNKRIFDMACEYVMKGAQVIEGLPLLSFGALTTIDRWEIEAYRNICNLIENYVGSDSVRPLSIAVFGAPGSGKSFGVTQIANNILPGKVKKLEFNVSQFVNNTDLGAAFQQVRDVTLEGKLPLVFFDEFDSDRDGIQLGWVKNFLMPMQDGKFKDESGEHPLGKCILVFAGGTSASFEEFSCPMTSDNDDVQKKFKDIKGPDFVSRLRGTINVLGPNQTRPDDKNYILRRAILLRSLCERKLNVAKGGVAPLDKNVLRAMLLVPKYKHGARSMEAILDMSRIEGNVWEPVSLPFYSQLSLHVDADAFVRLVLREVILHSYIEKLAVAIHKRHFTEMMAAGQEGHPSVVTWQKLSEELKESNRSQVRDITSKLKDIGCEYDAGDTPFASVEQFEPDTLLLLAQKEHLRWWEEKEKNGWIYAPLSEGLEQAQKTMSAKAWNALDEIQRKNAAIREMRKEKKSHLLISWDDLEDEERQKDLAAVENIIPLLNSIGLRVYRVI